MEYTPSCPSPQVFKHLGTITACFTVVLILSNIVSAKLMNFFGFPLDAGIIIFPLSYILGDVLAEVYGFAASRRAIWTGFALLLFTILVIRVATIVEPAAGWPYQGAFEQIFGLVPRISLASLIGYLFGEITNSWTLVRIKQKTGEKKRWLRLIGSTLVGEAVDTTLFLAIAFGGVWPITQLIAAWKIGYLFKVGFEIPLLPLTYRAIAWLKKAEVRAEHEQKAQWFAVFQTQTQS